MPEPTGALVPLLIRPLSEGFGEQLVNLTDFNLHGCVQLQALPESICNMRSLTKLDLSGDDGGNSWKCGPMSIRALPERFGELPSLEDLNLAYCHALAKNEGTYAILSKISTLTKLSLRCCDMVSLPEGSP